MSLEAFSLFSSFLPIVDKCHWEEKEIIYDFSDASASSIVRILEKLWALRDS